MTTTVANNLATLIHLLKDLTKNEDYQQDIYFINVLPCCAMGHAYQHPKLFPHLAYNGFEETFGRESSLVFNQTRIGRFTKGEGARLAMVERLTSLLVSNGYRL